MIKRLKILSLEYQPKARILEIPLPSANFLTKFQLEKLTNTQSKESAIQLCCIITNFYYLSTYQEEGVLLELQTEFRSQKQSASLIDSGHADVLTKAFKIVTKGQLNN